MRILFIGDIVGKGGRRTVTRLLPDIKTNQKIDVVVANVENIAHGVGVTRKTLREVMDAGIDVATSGNHIFSKPEANELVADKKLALLRPHNFLHSPGSGTLQFPTGAYILTVINLEGTVFMDEDNAANPFKTLDEILQLPETQQSHVTLIDFHAEATSEKVAFGWHADGKVSAVVGTHTHVATADQRVLPKGTAFISDVGMTGPWNSVIGVDKDVIVNNFMGDEQQRHIIPEEGEMVLNAVIIDIDEKTKLARNIERFDQYIKI